MGGVIMQIIGAGVGRTGTFSLKLALNELGVGPCHHMEVVLHDMAMQVPLWNAAIADHPDWASIYKGFNSAVDWPTACFFRELSEAYPTSKFILTQRNPENWADSFLATIRKLIDERDQAPPEMLDWLEMANDVIAKTGFPEGLSRNELIEAFNAHNDAVQQTIPIDRLLVYEVKQGWGPLCEFLGVPVPSEPFPRTNKREEFWDLVQGNA
jgi:hypothetical protein